MIYIFDWLGDFIGGIGSAIGGVFDYLGEQISNAIWNTMLQWFYETIYNAVADFFTMMGNMGADVFDLEWVQATINLFTLFGWALFAAGTVVAVFENIISFWIDMFGISRKKSVLINTIIILIASLPCVFGFNIWSGFQIFGQNVLGMEDFLVSNILLPVGSLVYLLFCVTKFGWGFDNYLDECNTGKGIKFSKALKPYFKYVLPVLVLILIVQGFIK